MQEDFHYYATYSAAVLAGYSHEESLEIAYADQFTDHCTETLLKKLKGPASAATTQMQTELINSRTDPVGLQKITRIWASFHFLPYDLNAVYPGKQKPPRRYMNKYRLICRPNSALVEETVRLAKGQSLPAVGIAMHVLADTWAHSYFAGTPANVINNVSDYFFEIRGEESVPVRFRHNPTVSDDPELGLYTASVHQENENSIMNLGHGRAGHLPDYSFCRYRYLPVWNRYEEILKDNPSDYYHAYCQMIAAMQYLRGESDSFVCGQYAEEPAAPYRNQITEILEKRQLNACQDWKAFGEALSGCEIPEFDLGRYQQEYTEAAEEQRDDTFLGRYFLAALAQKSMVTHRIFESGNLLAGFSVRFSQFRGNRDYWKLIKLFRGRSST